MRKLGILFLSLVMILIFFTGFYLYYVPANKESLDKYAFLILHNMRANLEFKVSRDISMYNTNLSEVFVKDSVKQGKLDDVVLKLSLLNAEVLPPVSAKSNSPADSAAGTPMSKSNRIQGEVYDISDNGLTYVFQKNNRRLKLSVPVSNLLGDILETHQNDFYQSFIFLKVSGNKAIPVFKSEGLDLGTEISPDSLLPGSKTAFYPGTSEVHIGDQDLKMFYIPVSINGRQFVLAGFKNAQEYSNGVHRIPTGLIYPFAIMMLLLLVIMPLIKLYIMGPGEKVKIWDFLGYCFSLFVASMFITIIIIQVILLNDGDTRMEANLPRLSRQIDRAFRQELRHAYRQLQDLDELPGKNPDYQAQKDLPHPKIDISDSLRKYMLAKEYSDSTYYHFDRVSWIDSSGKQIMKGEMGNQKALYPDVSDRKYFRDLVQNRGYRLPGSDSIFSLEPVYNWNNGEYRIVLAKRSRCPRAFIVSLSLMMYSVNQTLLPTGFGFCIIDPEGNVQVHSDSSHNLKENFLEEVENAGQLKDAIAARQKLYLSETEFYGRKNGLLVTPIQGLPFFLVTFYDKGYIMPVNMRILIFSLLFCFISFLICLAIWMIIFHRRYNSRPLLFSPMDYLQWIIPRKKNAVIYFAGFLFLSLYTLALLLIIFLTNAFSPENNYNMLIILLLTPPNIVCGLMVTAGIPKARPALIILTLVDIAGVSFYYSQGFQISLILFQGIILALFWIVHLSGFHFEYKRRISEEKYLLWYSVLIQMLVVCLSVLPAALFTWYAHNHEIVQAVKKEQLFLAFSIENRKYSIHNQLKEVKPVSLRNRLFDTLQYSRGTYRINRDKLSRGPGPLPVVKADSGFKKFYFDVADHFSNDYYDPQSLPALQEGSTDNLWQWPKTDSDANWLSFNYTMSPDRQVKDTNGQSSVVLLHVQSLIPDRYVYLENKGKLFVLLLLIALIFSGIYILIRRISEGIFLQKFIQSRTGRQLMNPLLPFLDAYCSQEEQTEAGKKELAGRMKAITLENGPIASEDLMNREEQRIVGNMRTWEKYYAFVLSHCSPKEKYLLYNFALDSFINYKNVTEIYHLLDQGILIVKDQEIRLFSRGFRAYILYFAANAKPAELEKPFTKTSSWESFKLPFMVLLFAVAAFIFFTQQDVWQRFSALVAGLGTSLSVLASIFGMKGKSAPPS